jgi:hypothetical protein
VAIIWPCALSPSAYAAAGKHVAVPAQRCPECLGWLNGWGGYWRWLRAPLLVERIWIRRGRCPACRRSHALLPDLVLARRLDVVDVIGEGLALKVVSGRGLRPIAEHLSVPHTTARTWWQRFRLRSWSGVLCVSARSVSPALRRLALLRSGPRCLQKAQGEGDSRVTVRVRDEALHQDVLQKAEPVNGERCSGACIRTSTYRPRVPQCESWQRGGTVSMSARAPCSRATRSYGNRWAERTLTVSTITSSKPGTRRTTRSFVG